MAVWKSKILVLGVSHSPNVLPVSRLVQTDQLVGLCQNMSQSFLLAIWYFPLVKCSWQTKALWPWRVLGHGGSGSAEVPCLGIRSSHVFILDEDLLHGTLWWLAASL